MAKAAAFLLFLIGFCIESKAQNSMPMLDFPTTDGTVLATLQVGDTLFVGGNFTQVFDDGNTYPRNYLFGIDLNTNNVLPWDPGLSAVVAPYPIASLASAGDTLVVGGHIPTYQGATTGHILGFNLTTGNAIETSPGVLWAPVGFSTVNNVAIWNNQLFASCRTSFASGLGTPHDTLLVFNMATALLEPVGLVSTYNFIQRVYVHSNQLILIGVINPLNTSNWGNLAVFDLPSYTLDLSARYLITGWWDPTTSVSITDSFITFPDFFDWNFDVNNRYFYQINRNTGDSTLINCSVSTAYFNISAAAFSQFGNKFYFGNKHTQQLDGQTIYSAAAWDASTQNLTAWVPRFTYAVSPNDSTNIREFIMHNNDLIVAGDMDSVITDSGLKYIGGLARFSGNFATVSGKVFRDLNADGIQQPGEVGLPNCTVTFSGLPITASTNAQGNYSINIPPGNYSVGIDAPYLITQVFPAGGNTITANIPAVGNVASNVNFGVDSNVVYISGNVFFDYNADGVQQAGEFSIPNVQIGTTLGAGNPATTNAQGEYVLALEPGSHSLTPTSMPLLLQQVFPIGAQPQNVNLPTNGSTIANVHFGLDSNVVYVSGKIFYDLNADGIFQVGEVGIQQRQIVFQPGNHIAYTTIGGNYLKALPPGAYTATCYVGPLEIQVFPANNTPQSVNLPTNGTSLADVNLGLQNNSGTLSGKVFNDLNADGIQQVGEAGVQGALVASQAGNYYGFTNSQGNYSFQVPIGVHTLSVSSSSCWGQVSPPLSNPITVNVTAAGQSFANLNIGVQSNSAILTGRVFRDTNGDQIYQSGEPLITSREISFAPYQTPVYTNAQGIFYKQVCVGQAISINCATQQGELIFYPAGNQPHTVSPAIPGDTIGNLDFVFANNMAFISGSTFFDINQDGVQNGGDSPYKNRTVVITPGPYITSTNSSGNFLRMVPISPNPYTIEVDTNIGSFLWPQVFPVALAPHTALVPNAGDLDSDNHFGFLANTVTDLAIYSCLNHNVVAGMNFTQYFYVYNPGNTISAPTTLIVTMDPNFMFQNASAGTTLIGGSQYSIPVSAIQPNASVTLFINATTPGNTPAGTPWMTTCMLTNPDADLTNNEDTLAGVVLNSYDPNDKQRHPGVCAEGYIPNGETVFYRVRFQNTGNYPAFSVVLRDTLSPHLDPATLRLVGSSHPVSFQYDPAGQLMFWFPGIVLQTATVNEPASNGFVEFAINPRPGLAQGTAITNCAGIYFDQNDPIITNTVLNTIDDAVSPHPVPVIGLSDTVLLVGQPLEIEDLSDCSDARQFLISDGSTSVAAQFAHNFTAPGQYTITLRALQGGRVQTTQRIVTVGAVGIAEPAAVQMGVRPNPNTGTFTLSAHNQALPANTGFELHDVLGRCIPLAVTRLNDASVSLQGQSPLSPGTYVLSVTVPSHARQVFRVVVQ